MNNQIYPYASTGAELKAARLAAGLSIKQLASKAGTGHSQGYTKFYDAERGSRRPSARLLKYYAHHCNAHGLLGYLQSEDGIEGLWRLFERPEPLPEEPARRRLALPESVSYLRSPGEFLDAALVLLDFERRGLEDPIYIATSGRPNVLTKGQIPSRRREFVNRIKRLTNQGLAVRQLVPDEALADIAPMEILRRFIGLQDAPGAYAVGIASDSGKPGHTDVVVRRNFGALVILSTSLDHRMPSEAFLFAARGAHAQYVEALWQQAQTLFRQARQPFTIHDQSDRNGISDRRLRVESALAEIEKLPGPRMLLKNGMSDLLMSEYAYIAYLKTYADDNAADSDEYWMRQMQDLRSLRLQRFRKNCRRYPHDDVVPVAAVIEYLSSGLSTNDGRRILSRRDAQAHIRAVLGEMRECPNFTTWLVEPGVFKDWSPAKSAALLLKGDPLSESWRLYYESSNGFAGDKVTVAFESADLRFASDLNDGFQRLVRSHVATTRRSHAREMLEQLLAKYGVGD